MNRCLVKRNHYGKDIDSFFNNFFQTPFFNLEISNEYSPRVNIVDAENELKFIFELPGMEKEAIKVLVKDNVLTISGDRKYKSEIKDNHLVRREIKQGTFKRSFTIPDYVDVKGISAEYKNGLLKVKLTKKEEVKPKEIDIRIS